MKTEYNTTCGNHNFLHYFGKVFVVFFSWNSLFIIFPFKELLAQARIFPLPSFQKVEVTYISFFAFQKKINKTFNLVEDIWFHEG